MREASASSTLRRAYVEAASLCSRLKWSNGVSSAKTPPSTEAPSLETKDSSMHCTQNVIGRLFTRAARLLRGAAAPLHQPRSQEQRSTVESRTDMAECDVTYQ